MFKHLKLKAENSNDLAIISGLIQDGIFCFADTKFHDGLFNILFKRFSWETQLNNSDKDKKYIRVNSILTIENVKEVKTVNKETVSNVDPQVCLSITRNTLKDEDLLYLNLAGNIIIKLKVSKIRVFMQDVDDYWYTDICPNHSRNKLIK